MTSPTKFYHVIQIILFMWPKFGNSSISMREVITTSVLTRKTAFSERWSWFKFNYLGLALGAKWNIYTSVAKGLKRKVLGASSYVCRSYRGKTVTGEKRVRVAFLSPPPSWIVLTIIESLGNPRHNINDKFFKWQ